jgi:hypothetical protein
MFLEQVICTFQVGVLMFNQVLGPFRKPALFLVGACNGRKVKDGRFWWQGRRGRIGDVLGYTLDDVCILCKYLANLVG